MFIVIKFNNFKNIENHQKKNSLCKDLKIHISHFVDYWSPNDNVNITLISIPLLEIMTLVRAQHSPK